MDRAINHYPLEAIEAVLHCVRGEKRDEIAKAVGKTRDTIQRVLRGGAQSVSLDLFLALCRHYKIDPSLTGKLDTISDASVLSAPAFPIVMLGAVSAGAPASPGESVFIDDELDRITVTADAWRGLFPGVDPRGLAALKINGDSMAPRHRDGELIFVRQTTDTGALRDGQQVVIFLPGDGYTFKIWRDTGVVEGINPAFKPRPLPKGSKLWGVYVCGTKME